MTAAAKIRLSLAHGGDGAAWHCLDLALAAAREAVVKAITDNERRKSPADQLAIALLAADETLEELAVVLSEGGELAAG
jgi:hypothetical protein